VRDERISCRDDRELRENSERIVREDKEDERNGANGRVDELAESDGRRADSSVGGDKDGE